MRTINILFIFLIAMPLLSLAQVPTPADMNGKSVLLMNGVAHIGNGEVIRNSAIGFKDGKITVVANALITTIDVTQFDTVINIKGKHVYPGFIAPNSTLGLVEVEAVRATRDFNEVGSYNPNVRSLIAFNTDSKVTPTVRTNGVLMGQITPRGGRISGTSSVVHFDGWNWEDAVIKKDDGIHLNWPRMYNTSWWSPNKGEKNKNYDKQYEEMVNFFKEAKAYASAKENQEKDLRFEAMKGLFDGTKKLYVHCDFSKEIVAMVNFKKEVEVEKVVLVGGYESYLHTELLNSYHIPVMIRRIHSLPERTEEDVDLPFKIPAMLEEKGVLWCFENSGDMEAMNARNLPFLAGTAVAYGLDYEKAVQALSLNTAKILGIEKTCGSLEQGKDATLFVSEGDALDMRTNKLKIAFVKGGMIDLSNHQVELYEKYSEKFEHTE